MRRSADTEDQEPQAEPEAEPTPEPESEAQKEEEPAPTAQPLPLAPFPADGHFPLADPGEYYIGLWSGKPNFGCPYCAYASLEGDYAVEMHILAKIDQGNAPHMKALELK